MTSYLFVFICVIFSLQLMGQLSHMIDKRRVYLQDESDSSSDDSDFD